MTRGAGAAEEALTAADIAALEAQTPEELARGWKTLNSWGWPTWLPDGPKDFGDAMQRERQSAAGAPNRGWAAMTWIMDKIGLRACLREWNRERMTDEEFAAFFGKGRELSAGAGGGEG